MRCFYSYGDRHAKTLLGKVFAVFWTLTGLIVVLILTSSIAEHLTTYTMKIDKSLYGKQVRLITVKSMIIEKMAAVHFPSNALRLKDRPRTGGRFAYSAKISHHQVILCHLYSAIFD